MTEKNIRCGLVTLCPFPIGNVSTLRYSSYLRSLASKGVFTKVYIFAPTATAKFNSKSIGKYKGVFYEYLQGITWKRKAGIFIKGYYYLRGLFLALNQIHKDRITHLIIYHQELFSYFVFLLFAHITGIKLIADKSEYPYGYRQMSLLKKRITHLSLKIFDGFIVMTNDLKAFYTIHKKQTAKIFLLPMTIDSDRFSTSHKDDSSLGYIAVVFGAHNRDGLFESIKCFASYCKKVEKPLLLKLIGDFDALANKKEIMRFIISSKISSKVIFLGRVSITEVPQILINAKILMTTANEYISGGFPTKIGEYMLSDVPVIATRVGELPQFLSHMHDVFFVEPNDYNGTANMILYIIENYDKALKVSANAKQTVLKKFNANSYIDDLLVFFESL